MALGIGIANAIPFTQSTGIAATSTESLYFDGVDETANPGQISALIGASAFTYMAWIRPDTVSGSDRFLYQYFNGNRNTRIDMSNAKLNVIIRNAGVVPSYGNIITDNDVFTAAVWQHLTITFNAGTVVIYVDADSKPFTDSGTTPVSTANNAVDSHIIHVGGPYEGYIDELAIFDYAMTAGEVATAYNGGVTNDYMELVSGAPEHYYKFETGDGDDATNVTDQGDTSGNPLVLSNIEIGDYTNEVP